MSRRRRYEPRRMRIGLFILFCWTLSGAVAGAEQISSSPPKPGSAPTPIPLAEIASEADSTLRSVQSIESTLSTDPITGIVEKRLPSLAREIELRGAEMAKFLRGSVPLELLHSMGIALQTYRDQLSNWNRDLNPGRSDRPIGSARQYLEGDSRIARTIQDGPGDS
jgi:hypothetical protein